MEKAWWKEAVVYQIYPRSFQDSNGDGIGDLQGIVSRLNYISKLGADVIWLCPVYQSPNDDNGYDISDYQSIMSEFGTLEDFEFLLKKAHEKGLKIVMDLVVNHTSDEHKWFLESRSSKENPYRDYYIWREGKDGKEPNNWGSRFSGSAWKYDIQTGMYVLHLYSTKQPDLNWENPEVRNSVFEMMKWWLDKGIDGFRMDVINMISKVPGLPDGEVKNGLYGNAEPFSTNGPRVHEYLREMNEKVLSHYDIMTVGETPNVSVDEASKYAGFDTQELNMVFQFEHVRLDYSPLGKWSESRVLLADLKKTMSRWQTGMDGCGWNSLYWNNHDQPRAVSRFGDDSTKELWEKSAKMLGTCLHMLQGTPYIYQGEELGMTNIKLDKIEDYRDIQTINAYEELTQKRGIPTDTMMKYIHHSSRDNARTPMQWNKEINAGFSTGTPWIKVNTNYLEINAEAELEDENSIFYYYQKLIALRKQYNIMVYGSYRLILEEDEKIYGYLRELENQRLLVLCNFSKENASFVFPAEIKDRSLLLCNYKNCNTEEPSLLPYEARVYLAEV